MEDSEDTDSTEDESAEDESAEDNYQTKLGEALWLCKKLREGMAEIQKKDEKWIVESGLDLYRTGPVQI